MICQVEFNQIKEKGCKRKACWKSLEELTVYNAMHWSDRRTEFSSSESKELGFIKQF